MIKFRYLFSALLLVCALLPAQADDFGLWTEAAASQKLGTTGLKLDGNIGFRANNHWKSVDRWNVGLGLSYDLTTFLEVAGAYNFIYSYSHATCEDKFQKDDDGNVTDKWIGYNVDNGYWRTKNRFSFSLKGKWDIGRFSFSLRERYQATIFNHTYLRQDKYRFNREPKYILDDEGEIMFDDEGNAMYETDADGNPVYDYTLQEGYPEIEMDRKRHKTTHFLRSRLQVEYNIRKCPVNPYAAFEISNNLSNGFSTDKRRWSAGVDWKIKKGQHLSVGYVYSNGNDDDDDGREHIIELSYKIKGLLTK